MAGGFVLGRGFLEMDLDPKKMESKLSGVSKKLGATAAGIGAAVAASAIAGLTVSIKAAMGQQEAEKALEAALRRTGDATDANMAKFSALASQIQKVTTLGDEEVLQQIALAKNLGVSTDSLDQVTVAAIGLSKRLNIDLKTAMQLLSRATQGQFQMFTRYGLQLDETASDQEKLNQVMAFSNEGFKLAQAETETLAGKWSQLKNAAGDIAEKIGTPLLDPLSKLTAQFSALITDLPWDSWIKTIVDGFGDIFKAVVPVANVIDKLETPLQKFFEKTGFGGSNQATGRAAVNRAQLMGGSDVRAISAAQTALKNVSTLHKASADSLVTASKVLVTSSKNLDDAAKKFIDSGEDLGMLAKFWDNRSEQEIAIQKQIDALSGRGGIANSFSGLDDAFRSFSTQEDNTGEKQLKVLEEQLKLARESREWEEAMLREGMPGASGIVVQ